MTLFKKIFDLENGYIHEDKIVKIFRKTYYEEFDSGKLQFIINNKDDILDLINRPNAQDKVDFNTYLNESEGNIHKVKYFQIDNGLHGRYYASNGAAAMLREVRHTIFYDYYNDYDFVNCHPVILSWMCKNMNIECPRLNEYIANRDVLKVGIPNIKILVLAIINGGKKEFNALENKSEFIIDFYNEMKNVRGEVTNNLWAFYNKAFHAKKDPSFNMDGSCMSYIMQFVEGQLLNHLITEVNKMLTTDQKSKLILCFDGIMIPKDAKIDLVKLNTYIQNLGIDITISKKTMKPINLEEIGYEEVDYDELDAVENVEIKCVNNFNFDEDYYYASFENELNRHGIFESSEDVIKFLQDKFTKVCAFVNDNIIIKNDSDNNYRIIPRSKLINSFIQYKYGKKTIQSSLNKILFANMKYFNVFTKSVSDFSFPRDNKTFDLSRPYKARIIENVNQESVDTFSQFVKEIICNDEEDMFNYIWNWLIFICKFPHLKSKVALFLVSKEGCGKGFLIDFLCHYIMGDFNTIPNMNGIDQLVGEKNLRLLGKKLVSVNELSSTKDTFSASLNKIKSIITEDDISIRPLYCEGFNAKQTLELVFSSNFANSMIISESDRRMVVPTINEVHQNDKAYFGTLRSKLYNMESANSIYTTLFNSNLKSDDFYRMRIPISSRKQEIKDISKSNCCVFIDEYREDNDNDMRIETKDLWNSYLHWCSQNNEKAYRKQLFKSMIIEYGVKFIKSNGKLLYIL